MKVPKFIHDLLGRPARPQPVTRREQPRPRSSGSRPRVPNPDEHALLVDKAASQFAFIDRAWKLGLWRDPAHYADWKHDLTVKRQFADLTAISLETVGADGRVLFRHKITLDKDARRPRFDEAGGVELPLLDRTAIKSARLLVFGAGREDVCRHLLRLPWSDTKELPLQPGDAIAADHAAKITGGRAGGELHIAATARHRLEVTQTGARPYAFARDLDRPLTGIFLHKKHAPPGCEFRIGQRLLAHVISVPRGLQARSIHFA
ncbi:MAG: hypothetical protein QOD99_977 [Chthoniobacter sp.]|jgi:hypothetical protein|nr:hypothetical protein [Chthoniobacter sp.]